MVVHEMLQSVLIFKSIVEMPEGWSEHTPSSRHSGIKIIDPPHSVQKETVLPRECNA